MAAPWLTLTESNRFNALMANNYDDPLAKLKVITAVIVALAFIALGIASFFTPVLWQGGVLPSLAMRVTATTILVGIGTLGLAATIIFKIATHKR